MQGGLGMTKKKGGTKKKAEHGANRPKPSFKNLKIPPKQAQKKDQEQEHFNQKTG